MRERERERERESERERRRSRDNYDKRFLLSSDTGFFIASLDIRVVFVA